MSGTYLKRFSTLRADKGGFALLEKLRYPFGG